MTQRGSAGADYIAVIAVVGIIFAGLLVMRPQRVGPKSPVDVLPPIIRLLGHPVQNLEPRPAAPRASVIASGTAAQAGDPAADERPRGRTPTRVVADARHDPDRRRGDARASVSGHTRMQWDLAPSIRPRVAPRPAHAAPHPRGNGSARTTAPGDPTGRSGDAPAAASASPAPLPVTRPRRRPGFRSAVRSGRTPTTSSVASSGRSPRPSRRMRPCSTSAPVAATARSCSPAAAIA